MDMLTDIKRPSILTERPSSEQSTVFTDFVGVLETTGETVFGQFSTGISVKEKTVTSDKVAGFIVAPQSIAGASFLAAAITPVCLGMQLLRKALEIYGPVPTYILITGAETLLGRILVQLAKNVFEIEWVAVTLQNELLRQTLEDLGADEIYVAKSKWSAPFVRSKAIRRYDLVIDIIGDRDAKKLLSDDTGLFFTLRPQTVSSFLWCGKPKVKQISYRLVDSRKLDKEDLENLAILLEEHRLQIPNDFICKEFISIS